MWISPSRPSAIRENAPNGMSRVIVASRSCPIAKTARRAVALRIVPCGGDATRASFLGGKCEPGLAGEEEVGAKL